MRGLEIPLTVPDLWQQQAVRALREGRDVVVHAPTGAGKTFIFEMAMPSIKGQAIFTVPTRALANDKLAEWRAKGWNVGIATGDVAHNLDAPVVVATLETQKFRLLNGDGPRLLVIDEYQMIADPVRGVNYELAIALAPAGTQLLLLSGSVANPQEVVAWLQRIGRDALLVEHKERPVPQEEIDLANLPEAPGAAGRGYWPRMLARALKAGLGPVLVFAPRRKAAEQLAQTIAAGLPAAPPLSLTPEQEMLATGSLGRLVRQRVVFHHSGLSYAQRAGLIEPLAKAGQLQVVVATMGLAAGINFSMRSVLVTDTRYKAGNFEQEVQPDALLQMFGRAGRRGLDETGYILINDRVPRLHQARARQLRRVAQLDWTSLLSVMQLAATRGNDPFAEALRLNRRMFSTQELPLGVEHSQTTGPMPCGLWVDMERARFVRRGVVEMRNSRGEWEPQSEPQERGLGEARLNRGGRWLPALQFAETLQGRGEGPLCKFGHGQEKRYGRELHAGRVLDSGLVELAKPWKKLLHKATAQREELPGPLAQTSGGDFHEWQERGGQLFARFDFSPWKAPVRVDSHGLALIDPPTRENLPACCRACPELEIYCRTVPITPSAAHAWRRLGLIEPNGTPTRRGVIFSLFNAGEGLAIAVALEDESYQIRDLVFDLANLRAGHRFAEDASPYGGRLGALCQQTYERADYPGYLEMGVPVNHGPGASEVVREIVEHGIPRSKLLTESLRAGDIERALLEWRSLLRHIASLPDQPWERWQELQREAREWTAKAASL